MGTHPKNSHLKQLQIHFKATKREKGVGMPFPRVPVPLHPCPSLFAVNAKMSAHSFLNYRFSSSLYLLNSYFPLLVD